VEARRDQDAVLGLAAGRDRSGRDDARHLDLQLDGAVLVEVPEEAVLVVPDGGDGGDDEAARAPHLDVAGAKGRVLPEKPEVLFVQTNSVLQRDRLAVRVGHDGIEGADLAETIAAEVEAIGEPAHAVLALVEGVLSPARRRGDAGGTDSLGEAR